MRGWQNEWSTDYFMTEHSDHCRIAVIDGNVRYTVVANGKVRYNGNNPLKYYWAKFRFRKGPVITTIKNGRQGR